MDSDELRDLTFAQRILRAAIYDQKLLVEIVPRVGIPAEPYEQNLARLKRRLLVVQRRIVEMDPD